METKVRISNCGRGGRSISNLLRKRKSKCSQHRTETLKIRCTPLFKEVLQRVKQAAESERGKRKISDSDIISESVADLAEKWALLKENEYQKFL